MSIPDLKRCKACGADKPRSDFSQGKAKCKPCFAAEKRERYRADPEARERYKGAQRKSYGRKCADPAFVEAERTRLREYQRAKLRTDAAWRDKRRAYYAGRYREWYARYERERRQERQRTDPAFHAHLMKLAKAGQQRRRARIAAVGGSYTPVEWDRLCALYGHCCVRCEATGALTVDHVVPLSRGGRNDVWNLQPLCRSCNSQKHTRIADYRPFPPPMALLLGVD
jgi:5-methylcytosine-specific restriction endonuclease McrA